MHGLKFLDNGILLLASILGYIPGMLRYNQALGRVLCVKAMLDWI